MFLVRGERATSPLTPAAGEARDAAPAAELDAGADAADPEARRVKAAAEDGTQRDDAARGGESGGCTVEGLVSDASGAALVAKDGCRVRFEDASGEGRTADAGEDGGYSISGLAPGRWIVSC